MSCPDSTRFSMASASISSIAVNEASASIRLEELCISFVRMEATSGISTAKNAKVMWPVRIAAAGKAVTPGGAVEICRILGKDETLRRLNTALEKLG